MTKTELSHHLFFNFCIILLKLSLLPRSVAIVNLDKDLISGKHFIVGTAEIPPYIFIKRDSNGTVLQVDGFVNQIVRFLAREFSFTFEYVEVPNGITGSCINNTCNGLVGMLIDGEIDLVATGFSVTLSRSRMIDFTFPFSEEPIGLLIPYPRKLGMLNSIREPFSNEVWILLVLSLMVCSYFMSWTGYVKARCFNRFSDTTTDHSESSREIIRQPGKFGDNIMILLRVLVNYGYQLSPGIGDGFRILVAAWCLGAVVISKSYNTSLKSFLTLSRYRPAIRSLSDLTKNSEYSFAVRKYSSVWSNMMEAKTGPFAKIGDILRKYPENSLETLTDKIDLVLYRKKVFAQFESSNLFMIEEDMKATGKCRLHTAQEHFDESRISFGLPKNSHILNKYFSHELMWLKQSGLLEHWKSLYWPRTNRCSAPISTKAASKRGMLTLRNLTSAFLLLGVGLTGSIASFIAELIRSYGHHRTMLFPTAE